jgi:hypothetical protein
VDNCQVGVFGALCGGSLVNLVQAKLTTKEQDITKIDLARQMIKHVVEELRPSFRNSGVGKAIAPLNKHVH